MKLSIVPSVPRFSLMSVGFVVMPLLLWLIVIIYLWGFLEKTHWRFISFIDLSKSQLFVSRFSLPFAHFLY